MIGLVPLFVALLFAGSAAYSVAKQQAGFRTNDGVLRVSFLDIGQGDSIYVQAPNGRSVLVDGGPDARVIDRLRDVRPQPDRAIDLMVETHPDKDHIAGLVSVLGSYEVKKFLHSEISSGTLVDQSLTRAVANEPGLDQIIARRGERIILDDRFGVYMDVLFPDQDTRAFKETNEASIVMRLVYGNESFLLTGDSPISVEHFLVARDGAGLRTTVLKLGHHGSKTSSSDEYLDAVKPSYAVVSAGKNNRYHHPSPETMERVAARKIPVLSTIDRGTITMETDGKSIWVK